MRSKSAYKKAVILGALLLVLGGGISLYFLTQSRVPSLPTGFELPDASGKSHRLSDFKEKAVIVHFWASWCPPCLDEIGQWTDFAKKYQGRSVQFVAVSLDKSWQDANQVLKPELTPANVLSLLDLSAKVPDQYGSFQFPETYLLNSQRRTVFKWVGPQKWDDPRVVAPLEAVLSGAQ